MKRAATTGTGEATLVILAGGRSSRMGRPKAELLVEGRTLLEQLNATYVDEDELTRAGIARQELADLNVPGDYDAFIRRRRTPA